MTLQDRQRQYLIIIKVCVKKIALLWDMIQQIK